MTSRDFCYWLQGYLELSEQPKNSGFKNGMTPDQVKSIRNHLALVFKHEIDPSEPGKPEENQAIHDGKQKPTIGGTGLDGVVYRC